MHTPGGPLIGPLRSLALGLSLAIGLVGCSSEGGTSTQPARAYGTIEGPPAEVRRALEAEIAFAARDRSDPERLARATGALVALHGRHAELAPEEEAVELEARALELRDTLFPASPTRAWLDVQVGAARIRRGEQERGADLLLAGLAGLARAEGPEVAYASDEASLCADALAELGHGTAHAELLLRQQDVTAVSTGPVAEIPVGERLLRPTVMRDGAHVRARFREPASLVVELPRTDRRARGATPEQTRTAVEQAFKIWERALQRVAPSFRFELREQADDADVRVRWQRRSRTYLPAYGELRLAPDGSARGRIVISPTPTAAPDAHATPHELRSATIHAIGRALGLPDCFDCDSVMGPEWRWRGLLEPSDLDIRSVQALLERPARELDAVSSLPAAPPPTRGVRADLPMINVGTGSQVVIDVAPRGSPAFVVLLDTGANTTVLTTRLARALGISVRSAKSDPYRRATIAGEPVTFWVTGQRFVQARETWDFALLGGEFLERFVVELDFAAHRVRLLDPAVHRVGDRERERVVPLQMNEKRPYVRLGMGNGAVRALVDTGAQSPISITEERARALGIEIDPKARRTAHRNVLGTSSSTVQTLDEVDFGGLTLRDVEIQITLRDESDVRVQRWLIDETLVGIDVLRDFVVRFDYPRGKLGLTPLRAESARGPRTH